MRFANPEALALLPLVLLVVWRNLSSPQHAVFRCSTLRLTTRLPVGWAVSGPVVLAALRGVALALLLGALARPQTPDAQVRSQSDGIAIQLVVDTSHSMRQRDFDLGSQSVTRLEAAKHAIRRFVAGGDGLKGRPSDKVGLMTFARYPEVICPLTLDHKALLEALERVELSPPVGTNIGDALAWALDRLRADPTRQKVMILLSDGSHNVPAGLAPRQAVQLAADLGVKVYTIGALGNQGTRPLSLAEQIRATQGRAPAGDSVDEATLESIASLTGGQYFRATDRDGLTRIYQEIDRLETTQHERSLHLAYREWFLVLLLPALSLLLLEQGLAATRLLRIP